MRIKTHLPNQIENIGKTIVDCSYRVHKTLGPVFLDRSMRLAWYMS